MIECITPPEGAAPSASGAVLRAGREVAMADPRRAYAVKRMSSAKLHEALGTELMRLERMIDWHEPKAHQLACAQRCQGLAEELRLRGVQLVLDL